VTTLGQIGEKAFLAALLPRLRIDRRFLNGFGDDASLLDLGIPDSVLAFKIDRAAYPLAVQRGWSDHRPWGRLAVSANCSDLITMGARPAGFMLAVMLPRDTDIHVAEEIILGAEEACTDAGVAFLGGDFKEAREPQVVGSALGLLPSRDGFRRYGGAAGDLLVLAGSLGGFLGALEHCERLGPLNIPPAVDYLSRPRAQWEAGLAMSDLGGVHSACDLSDGLFDALHSVAGAGAGADVDERQLPLHGLARTSAQVLDVESARFAFGVGDWGILYAVDPAERSAITGLAQRGLPLTIIGRLVDRQGVRLHRDGALRTVTAPIHEHFRTRAEGNLSYVQTTLGAVTIDGPGEDKHDRDVRARGDRQRHDRE